MSKVALVTGITGQDGAYLAEFLLSWSPQTSFAELVKEMVREDLNAAERDELVKKSGYTAYDHNE